MCGFRGFNRFNNFCNNGFCNFNGRRCGCGCGCSNCDCDCGNGDIDDDIIEVIGRRNFFNGGCGFGGCGFSDCGCL